MFKGSDTWSSARKAVLESCETMRRWSLPSRGELLGASLKVLHSGHTTHMLPAFWLLMQQDPPSHTPAAYQVCDHNGE